jgi:hypothetical protein
LGAKSFRGGTVLWVSSLAFLEINGGVGYAIGSLLLILQASMGRAGSDYEAMMLPSFGKDGARLGWVGWLRL